MVYLCSTEIVCWCIYFIIILICLYVTIFVLQTPHVELGTLYFVFYVSLCSDFMYFKCSRFDFYCKLFLFVFFFLVKLYCMTPFIFWFLDSAAKGRRSNSAIDLQAAQRAKARAQYAAMTRHKITSGTCSLRECWNYFSLLSALAWSSECCLR